LMLGKSVAGGRHGVGILHGVGSQGKAGRGLRARGG
jgi:hypothetical protein